jgi:hypothetical protein
MIYTTKDDNWQVSIDTRPNGLDVQVSYWDGEDFITRYDSFVIAESRFEAITDALLASGFGEWARVEDQATEWGITPPNEEEDN